jgi:hypothetical protein
MGKYICLIAALIAVRPARADGVDDLVARGQELAKRAEWTQAIALFKQADVQRPRAEYACMIGLAYTRRELWAQAELYFARCHDRATGDDPLPDWLGDAEAQLAAKVAGASITAITVTVAPPTAHAAISISGFEPDEVVAPGTFHLTPGRYTFELSAPGYVTTRRDVVVEAGKAQTMDVALGVVVDDRPSRTPWLVIGAGAAVAAAGFAIDLWKVRPLRTSLANASYGEYPMYEGSFDRWQRATIGLWVGGGVVTAIGAYLMYREHTSVTMGAHLDKDGGAVFVGWRR